MGDMADDFNAMRAERQDRHRRWKIANTKQLHEAGLFPRIANNGECCVFERPIKVDFYPSTGRWRAFGKTYSGGVKAFVAWYNRQMTKVGSPI